MTPDQINNNNRESTAAREEAIGRARKSVNPEWKRAALEAVLEVCQSRPTFIVDDVWEALHWRKGPFFAEQGTHERRAMGAVMLLAAKLGYCSRTNTFAPSNRVTCHRNPRTIWRSLVFEGEEGVLREAA